MGSLWELASHDLRFGGFVLWCEPHCAVMFAFCVALYGLLRGFCALWVCDGAGAFSCA